MSREAADVLRRAAQIQAERGHCKGKFEDARGRVCLHGAINAAWSEEVRVDSVLSEIRAYLRTAFDPADREYVLAGTVWNDLPETTGLDIEKFLLKAANEIELL